MKKNSFMGKFFTYMLVLLVSSSLYGGLLKDIQEKGELVVGVKADYKPWGFRSQNGEINGMEIDIAKDLAKLLDVKLKLIVVKSSNRIQFLETGKIDVMIATMSSNKKRAKKVGFIKPFYYASGVNMLAPKGLLKNWEDLRGKPICSRQGTYYNTSVERKYGPKLISFASDVDAKQALKNKRCAGFLSDDSLIGNMLANGQWDNFEMPLKTIDPSTWVISVSLENKDGAFSQMVSGVLYNYHNNGKLLELEKKWGITQSGFLTDMNKRFK